jgi:hypothetical protein
MSSLRARTSNYRLVNYVTYTIFFQVSLERTIVLYQFGHRELPLGVRLCRRRLSPWLSTQMWWFLPSTRCKVTYAVNYVATVSCTHDARTRFCITERKDLS